MPPVLRVGPYKFYFYSHEPNEPAHVHVDRDDLSAKIWLTPISVSRNYGFAANEITSVIETVEDNHKMLLEAWNGYFGN